MPAFRTLKLLLAYDGTSYVGWQRQESGVSIQGLLEAALGEIEGRDVSVIGAGRTDAGVHAVGQVASIRLAHPLDPQTLCRAINAKLPEDVRVRAVEEASPDFHARRAARGKTYRYRILCGPIASPFERRYAWHVPAPLDDLRMQQAARLLVGRHDFAAFQRAGSDRATTVRTVFAVDVTRSAVPVWPAGVTAGSGALITIEISGDGFLRHQVRAMVGALVEIGSGQRDLARLVEALHARDRSLAGPTAPPQGLFLLSVQY